MSSNAFSPQTGSGIQCVEIDVTDTASTAKQCKGGNNNATQRLVDNSGASSNECWLAWGPDATAAATIPTNSANGTGIHIGAGAILTLSFPVNAWFSAICATGKTTSLYITPGEGN